MKNLFRQHVEGGYLRIDIKIEMCRIRRNQPDEGLRQRTIWEYDGKCDNMKWGRMQFTRNPVAPAY